MLTLHPQTMRSSFVVVRSQSDTNLLVRLQSDPIIRGLQSKVGVRTRTIGPDELRRVAEGSCVIFHFNDAPAVTSLKEVASSISQMTVVCLGSDIYSFRQYLEVHNEVDLYVMPTESHRRILASQVYKPVYTVPEGIDPICGALPHGHTVFPVKHSRRVLWFGYPESFEKGMASLIPILKMSVREGSILTFELIVGMDNFHNRFELPATPFNADTFSATAGAFDYCLLSHFSLDLSLNSYIKSPNKLITALMTGLIPIASRTPSYEAILSEFGLQRFLFESPSDLERILRRLDPVIDSQAVQQSGIIEGLADKYSDRNVSGEFLRVLSQFDERGDSARLIISPTTMRATSPQLRLREHLLDLFPSAFRAMRLHLRRS